MLSFSDLNLNKALQNALADGRFLHPTPIQHKVFATMMSGRDVCGIAQTGTGKTFAYLLPCLQQWKFSKEKNPYMLILVPTRELVVQVVASIQQLTTYLNITAAGVYGGVNINTQRKELENGFDILVATPGRLIDLLLERAFTAKTIKKLVIDEVDEMLHLGFRAQLKNILDMLPDKRQNILFSATLTAEVEQLLDTYFKQPVRIEAAPPGTPLEHIEQIAYEVPNFYTKVNFLFWLLHQQASSMTKVLIFVSTKSMADELYEELKVEWPEKIGVIHSNKEQNYRFHSVQNFQNGTYRCLIATDVIARGIDIAEVSHVINFDIPELPEQYIHRIGRTGRADKKGVAISFFTEKEKTQLPALEALMKFSLPMNPLPPEVTISEVLTDDEKPIVRMKFHKVKLPKPTEKGPAFHPKSAKNSKVNVKISQKEKMMKKYGKPISRGAKKK